MNFFEATIFIIRIWTIFIDKLGEAMKNNNKNPTKRGKMKKKPLEYSRSMLSYFHKEIHEFIRVNLICEKLTKDCKI